MKRNLIIAGVLIIGAVFTVALIANQSPQPRQITIGMTYIPNVQFAPWYVAQEKGFFKELGMDVAFDYRMDIDALQLVATGQMDFAIAGGDQVITSRSQNIPVVYLLSLYAKFPPAVVALKNSGITKPQDLIGKQVGLPLYGTNLLAIKAILNRAGIPETEVKLVDIGYTQISSLTSGRVDAVVGFANNEPLKLEQAGYQVTRIPAWDYFSLVGHGLITGETTVKKNRKLVAKMVQATLKGMRYTLDHPEESLAICFQYLKEIGPEQRETEKKVFRESLKLWENELTKTHGLGYSDLKAWEDSQQLMLEMGLIKRTMPVEKYVDRSFLDTIKQ
ncbi:MAG: ABC transporter substrate-binding protein [Bacteroidota bacterium]